MKYGREWTAGLIAGLVAGAVAGWIGTTIGGWFLAVDAAHWWDVATAVGTVGATLAAVGPKVWDELKERRHKRADGALAIWAEQAQLLRMFGALRACERKLKEVGLSQATRESMLAAIWRHADALEGMLHPRYAAFDREFVRHTMEARRCLYDAVMPLDLDGNADVEMRNGISAARKHIESALDICGRAHVYMVSVWA